MDSEYKPTFFDSQLQNHQLQIMKTMIPYLSASQQRPFALLIKYMELQKTAQLFSNDTLTIQEVSSHSPQERMFQMLTDISEQCTPGEKENIENFLNMYQMLSAYDTLFSWFHHFIICYFMVPCQLVKNGGFYEFRLFERQSCLNDISPEKLQFLMDFASNNTDTKDAKSMASTVMNAANNAKQNGMTFSNTETTLLIELLKQNMSEAERVKADKMLQMMQMLQKKKK